VLTCEAPDVVVEGCVGEAVGEDAARLLVDFAGEEGGDAGGCHAEVGTADTGEQGDVVEAHATHLEKLPPDVLTGVWTGVRFGV
jgi:hypothetical protein